MAYIRSVKALEILDSRGYPTVEVQITTDKNRMSRAAVPSGASTGTHEALELRDGDKERYFGKGVERACAHVNGPIAEVLVGEHVFDQARLDHLMAVADGTDNKGRFGANAILGASMALVRSGALEAGLPLYRYIGGTNGKLLPCPMMNIINGGAHADNLLDFQEFMIVPHKAPSFREAVRFGSEVFHTLKGQLKSRKEVTAVGDEGGFAPNFQSNEEALEVILEAIQRAGYKPGSQVSLALDCAASEFFDKGTKKYIEKKKRDKGGDFAERTTSEQIAYLEKLVQNYPIVSIEDPLHEEDWKGWSALTASLGNKIQIVGDDLFVTNPKFLERGIQERAANAILIKLNQIGTVTETLDTIEMAKRHGMKTIISHRSGETEDTLIADLAVGTNAGQIKTGSLSRSDRIAKYNRLLNIEAGLASSGRFGYGF